MPKKIEAVDAETRGKIEAILFVAGEPVVVQEMAKALEIEDAELDRALTLLADQYDYEQRGFCIKRFGKHVQLATRAMYAPWVEKLLQPVQKQSLSQAAMETLAVVAYRQPVTRAEVELIRGVKCDYSLSTLMHKELVAEVGRKDTVGHSILVGTTDAFLSNFGIESLEQLPALPQDLKEDAEESVPLTP
mgnify:CR=1 FL=1